MAKFYLDTDVWIAYLDEKDGRNAEATKLFSLIERGKHHILISKMHHVETSNTGLFRKFSNLKNILYLKGVCYGIKARTEDEESARKLNMKYSLGFGDCLHLTLAKKFEAIAVSYDEHWPKIGEILGKTVLTPHKAINCINI